MTGRLGLTGLFSAMLMLQACSNADPAAMDELQAEAGAITQRFVGTLLPTLQGALATGGPASAIEVCSVQAPEIAATLAAETGWSVRRVSLRPRNQNLAIPDAWERAALTEFDQRQRAGEPGAGLRKAEFVDGSFRYLQAQPVMPLCLTCHGDNLDASVRSALAEYYPGDTATGYQTGEIRGAISLQHSL